MHVVIQRGVLTIGLPQVLCDLITHAPCTPSPIAVHSALGEQSRRMRVQAHETGYSEATKPRPKVILHSDNLSSQAFRQQKTKRGILFSRIPTVFKLVWRAGGCTYFRTHPTFSNWLGFDLRLCFGNNVIVYDIGCLMVGD